MRRRRELLAVGTIFCLAAGIVMGGRMLPVRAAENTLPKEDLSKGVTYELDDSGNIQFINLHGNSVIIEDVPAKDGESVKYRNFYIDKNRNGKIDSDEEKVSFSGSTGGESNEEGTGCPVYGLYGTSSTTPIRITVKGTKHSVIYGVYKGQLETEKETAVTIDLQTDNLSMACGAFNSKVSSVDMQVNGNVSTCFGAMGDSTVDKVQVHINSGKQEQIYGTENSSVGSVDITVARSNDDTSGTIYGVQGGTVNVADTSETAIHIAVSKGSVGVVKAMCGADVTTGKGINKAVAVEISGGNIMGSLDGISGGTVVMEETTGTALAIDVKGNTAVNGSLTGIQNTMGGSSDRVKVKGSVDINIDGQQGKSTTGICTAVNGAVDLDGGITVNVDHADMTCGLVMAQNGAVVEDDVLLDMGADASVTSGPGLKGIENAVAKKNVTLNVRGSSAASSSDDLYGAYGSVNGYNYTVGGDLTINYMGGTWGTLYGAYMNAHVQGNLTMRVKKGMIQGLKGTYQSNIGMDARILAGKYALESSDSMTEESAVVKIAGYQGVYGFAGRVGGDCEFRICNSEKEKSAAELDVFNGTCDIIGSLSVEVTGGKYSSCNRNAATHVIGKACNIVIQDVQLSGGYDSYALNGTRVNGECNITWKQVESNAAVYMISEGSFAGDVAVTASDSQSTDFYGLSGVGEIHGNYVMHCEGNGIADGTYSYYGNCYAVYSGRTSAPVIRGNVEIVMKDCRYNQFNGVSGVSVPEGTITIKLQGGNYATGLTPATVNSSNACKKLEFTAEGTSFGTERSNWTINNTIYGAGEVTETIADTCTLSGTYTVTNYCSSSYDKNAGSLRLMVGGNLYYAGYCRPEENVTAKNIYTCDGTLLHIPTGVTVQVEQNGFFYGTGGTDCLVEGTLKGAVDTRNGSWCKFFIHEGNLDSDTSGLKNVFYPISVEYNKTAGNLTWSGTSSLRLCEGILFGNTGSTVTVTGTAKKGYELQGAYAKKESDKDYSNMAEGTTDNSYEYTMTAETVAIRMDFAGTQISLGKSAPDPIAKLNEATTAEEPLYDMADVIISNDGEEGELTYALVTEQSNMPEGLQFADGKIYGTPTVLNETGSKVVIRVTGRNGSTADLSLVIKVTETGEGTGSQEGRIRVDAEKQEVHLQGNSVVIAANGEETAVYIDDDLDGVADFEEPAYSGNLSAYTVYGIKGATIRRPLQLTMTGGTVKSITVVENADVSVKAETDAVKMQMTGGKVSGGITMAEDAEITGTMALCISGDATYKVTNMTYGNNVTYDGWYQDIKGDVTIDGIYKLSNNIEIESIRINKNAKCTLSEGSKLAVNGLLYVRQLAYFYNNGEVKTGKTIIDNGGYVYNKGTYTCTGTFDNYGRFLVIRGTLLPEDNAFNQVYYPVDIQCDLKNTSLKKDNNTMGYYTVGDSVMLFGWAGADCSVSATDVPGYVPYISVNDNKLVEMGNNSYTFRMPRKATTLHLSYQPIQISAQKAFADPTAVIAREYTTDDPLYDLNNLVISDDTTSAYGQDMVYELQPGSELPAGLSLSEGKLIGTVAADAKDSDVTFIVTGRNGTTTEVQMHIAVSSEMTQRDINKLVKISGYTIDLQGTSVVIRQAAGDATKTSIYLDDDRDGIADNTNALQMNQSTELALSSYSICGCTKASESKVDGDISIYMYGGTVNGLYGVYGESNKIVRLNSDVAVYVKGGSIKSNTTAAQYAYAKNVTLDVQGGDLNRRVYAAYEPQNVDQVCFRFGDKAGFYNTNSGDEYGMAVTYKGTVKDIIATVGSDGNGRFSGKKASFQGVYKTKVSGNVEYTINGQWNPINISAFAMDATIAGNMNVEWKQGVMASSNNSSWSPAFLRGSQVADLNVSIPDGTKIGGNAYMAVLGSKANNIKLDAPHTGGKANVSLRETNGSSIISNSAYVNLNGTVEVDGTYTLEESLEADKFTTYSNAKLTIAEGVTVVSAGKADLGGTVVNRGTWISRDKLTINGTLDNYGELSFGAVGSTSFGLRIESLGKLINREDAVCELASRVDNVGKIVNYGGLKQSYYNSVSTYMTSVGKIYTTTKPKMKVALKNYQTIYYAVQTDYIEEYVSSVKVTDSSEKDLEVSGVDGDDNRYLLGGERFYVQVDAKNETGKKVSSITYNNGTDSGAGMTKTTTSGKWMGTSGYEPMIATLHFEGVTNITLDKDSDEVNTAQVGVTYPSTAPVYDLTKLVISGDDAEGTGTVTYMVDPSTALPTGLKLVNRVICGTPSRASNTAQTVKILVKGKNHTTAVFTLTFTKIEKGTPTVLIPDKLTALAGDTLASVTLPDYSLKAARNAGTYAWQNPDTVVGNTGNGKETYTAIFTPKDTENYNWDNRKGEDGNISVEVTIAIKKRTPEFTTPTGLTAIYGDTFASVVLPDDENGTFAWADGVKMEDEVGNVGAYTCYLEYTPNDQTMYEKVSNITVKLVVQPKKVITFVPAKTVFEVEAGGALGDIVLPTSEDGTYSWHTIATTIPENEGTYEVLFKPNDVKNYDWSGVEGYDPTYKGVIVSVAVKVIHVHDYGETWKSDKTYHWKECECGEVSDKAEHTWDAGKVTKEATATEAGEKTYTCTVCKVTRIEVIPATGETPEPPHVHEYGTTWKSDKTHHWKECECGEVDEKAEHTWDAGKVTKEATATEAGEKTYTCTACKVTRTEVIPATGEIPELPHVHEYGTTWKSDKTHHWKECECGEVSDKAEHTWDAGKVTKEATATEAGEKTYTCTVCKVTRTEVIPATGDTGSADPAEKPGKPENPGQQEKPGQVEQPGQPAAPTTPATSASQPVTEAVTEEEDEPLPAKGTILTDDSAKARFRVLSGEDDDPQVEYVGTIDKKVTNINIPEVVTLDDIDYDVVAIASGAFKNNKNLKKIVIPESVERIGSKAFYGCKKLTNITIKTTGLTTKTVGSKAFAKAGSNNYKKLTVKVPKKQMKMYKKMLRKRGLSAKAKIK